MAKLIQSKKRLMALLTALFVGSATTWASSGALNGVFTINENNDKVVFSKGNLQYIGSASTPYWKFADNQWDRLGNNGQGSASSNVDRDLFGWGTSGFDHGAVCYQPWSTSQTNSDYYAYGDLNLNLNDLSGKADWGFNAIINGGNLENSGWKTLTRPELRYILYFRNTTSGIRYAKALVNGINGLLLLPDNWNSDVMSLNNTDTQSAAYTSNVITLSQWSTLEQHGVVFLPTTGYRKGTSVYYPTTSAAYWTATQSNVDNAFRIGYTADALGVGGSPRNEGRAVRLVHPLELSINATPIPAESGSIGGTGTYEWQTNCTLTAIANTGYSFAYWSEDNMMVSTNSDYTFEVWRDRDLKANFVVDGNIVFSDINVKALCIANWDTNGDSELSYTEAATVTNLSTVFKNKTNITSFNELQYFIGLGSIGEQAFYGCTSLTQVTIPENVTTVGSKAFWNCPALQTVYFNAINCTSMQTYSSSPIYSVFSSDANGGASALTRVVIGSGVTRIPDYAFKGSVDIYQRLVIPASVTQIGNYAFYNCNSMVQMVIQGNGLQTIGQYAFWGCSALANALNLPNSVTTVGQYAFYGCSVLPSVTIGTGMTTIEGYAFWNCPALVTVNFNATNCTQMYTTYNSNNYSVFSSNTTGGNPAITTLTIGSNVKIIPNYAFKNTTSANSQITFTTALVLVGDYAFCGCSNLTGTLSISKVSNLGQYAFYNCSGFSGPITLCNTLTQVKQYTFYGCTGVTGSLIIPNSVTSIATYAFNGIHSTELTIGTGVTSIGAYAFWNCPSMTTLHFNATNCGEIKTMVSGTNYSVFCQDNTAGHNAAITTLTIGSNVQTIPAYAFYNNCRNIAENLVIPNSVTSIGNYAFGECKGLTGSLTLSNTLTTIGNYAFVGCNFHGAITIPNSVTTIGTNAFRYNPYITQVTIGTGVSSIGSQAFWHTPALTTVNFNATNCSSMSSTYNSNTYSVFSANTTGANPSMTTLSIGSNVTKIPDYAFKNCTNLTSAIVIPNATTTIGQYAFYGAHSSALTIGTGVTSIGEYAFWNCPSMSTVHFNATNCTSMVTNSSCSVFNSGTSNNGTTPIVTLTIGDNVTNIPEYAFRYSSNMTCDLVIPNSVTTIGIYSFANCSGHNVVIGNGAISIGNYAFYQSSGFNGTLLLGDALTSIGQYAFQGCSGFTGDLVIPNAVTTLSQYAFQGCNGFNGSLIIGSGVTTINQYVFADCSGFAGSLIVGRQVNSISNYAFKNCSAFSYVISENPTPPTAVNNSFQSMNFSIPLYVPYAMMPAYQSAAGWSQFTNRVEQCVFDQLDNDLWSDVNNWYAFALPGANDVVCVNSNCHMDMNANVLHLYVLNLNDVLTINSGKSLSTTYGVGTLQTSQLVIADGASLYNPISNAYGTVQKTINGFGSGTNGWYTVASPIYGGTPASTITTGTYDFYRYDEPTHYWRNQKAAANNLTTLNAAQGYLYASQSTRILSLAGQLNASNAEFSVPVTYQGSPLAGYTLVGNPYTHNLSIGDVKLNGTALTTYYKIVDGNSLTAYTSATPIKPGEAFLVMAPQGGTLTFSPSRNHIGDGTEPEGGDRELVRGFRLPTHSGVTDIDAFFADNITITATAIPEAGGTVSGAGTYAYGASCTLIATANDHYTFDHWTKNGTQVSTEATYTFSVTEEASYVANFSIATYALTATANPSTAGTVTGAGSYAFGTSCTLTATPSIGYQFVNWTMGDAVVSTSNSFTFTVSEAGDYVANFEICTYEVTAEAIPEEGGTVSGAGTFTYGQTTTLTATPNPGYEFDHWSEGYELQYFTIESLEDGNTITLTIPSTVPSTRVQSVSYSTDGGTTWHTTAIDETDQTINVTLGTGQRVIWKGTGKGYATANEASSYSIFSSTGSYEVKGNIASLLYGDDFIGKTTFPSNDVRAFQGLFFGSNKLVSAEKLVLPFMTLKGQCYKSMFHGCTSLAQVPELPATSLATNCYYSMFQNCRALTTAPELKATTLAPECYTAMFAQCIMLTQGPELPAHTLSGGCYRQMFMSCTSLNEVTCFATDVSASNCTQNWLLNVASTGTFHKAEGMTGWPTGASGVPSGWTVKDHIEDYAAEYFTIESLEDGNTITLTIGSAVTSAQLTYVAWSKDKTNWTSTTVDDTEQVISVPANAHEKVYWKGEGTNYATGGDNSTQWSVFSATGQHKVYGNILSLLYGDVFEGVTELPNATRTYGHLFKGDVNLTDAGDLELPATTLRNNCYQYLFNGCTSLVNAPSLPAMTMTQCCYQYMFMGCTSLVNAPVLPATTLGYMCYRGLFQSCTSLVIAPALPATTLANYCYQGMFRDCSSLTTAPELPATTMVYYCYASMFRNCTSLTTAPVLPASVLAERCYEYMFNGATSLNEVVCLATDISAPNPVVSWMTNVGSNGTFYKHPSMNDWPQPSGTGIPGGWTVKDYIADYAAEYFTIESLEDGNTITLTIGSAVTSAQLSSISYSTDNGVTWNATTVDNTTQAISVTLNNGQKAM